MIIRSEAERDAVIERRLGWLFALGGCIVILDQTLFKLAELPLWSSWWNLCAGALVAAIILLAASGLFLPLSLLRLLWWGIPLAYVAVQMTWVFASTQPLAIESAPWTWTLEPPIVTMLLLVLRPMAAVIASLMVSLAPTISALVFLGAVPRPMLLETPVQLANIVYVVIFIGVYLQFETLRAHESEARSQRRLQTRAAALAAEHMRVSRVVHDEVLSALAAAIQSDGVPPMVLKRAAAGALVALDESLGDAPERSGAVTARSALEELLANLRAIDGSFALRVELGEGSVPQEVARAASLAAAEALRNSVRHAGPGASRRVGVELSEKGARIAVSDDGIGFDPRSATDGMGIPESIERRMREVGGTVSVRSEQGAGAEVILEWKR